MGASRTPRSIRALCVPIVPDIAVVEQHLHRCGTVVFALVLEHAHPEDQAKRDRTTQDHGQHAVPCAWLMWVADHPRHELAELFLVHTSAPRSTRLSKMAWSAIWDA